MQILHDTRNTCLAQPASGMSAHDILTGTVASGFNVPGNGNGGQLAKRRPGMQCIGGPVSRPGDDV